MPSPSILRLAELVCAAVAREGVHMVPDPSLAAHILELGSGLLGKRFDDHDAQLNQADDAVAAALDEAKKATARAEQAESRLGDSGKLVEDAQKRTTVLQEQVKLEREAAAEKDKALAELQAALNDSLATSAALQKRVENLAAADHSPS